MLDTLHLIRITVEVASAIICIILVRFMSKPYLLTRESRYLGLSLGFSFLGISYAIAAIAYTEPFLFFRELMWLQFLTRTFSFVFLATTYYFIKQPSKNTKIFWNATLSVLIVMLIFSFLLVFIAPQVASSTYSAIQTYIRVFNVFCLSYVGIHTLRSHVRAPDPTTIWIPMGYVFLAISQYSLLFWYSDASLAAFYGALVLRLVALAVFLSVSYLTFYSSRERGKK